MEFDWGEEEGKKTKKSKAVYADSSELKALNIVKYDEFNSMGFQADILLPLMGANFMPKKGK